MSTFEPFSKRRRNYERLGKPDVYQYNELPKTFRIQVIHIWRDALGVHTFYDFSRKTYLINHLWYYMYNTVLREFGMLSLSDNGETTFEEDYIAYFLSTNVDEALDMIDISLHTLDKKSRALTSEEKRSRNIRLEAHDAIDELNRRFREHDIGYTFESGELIRIDSQYIHHEIIKPTISLLQEVGFEGAEEEFFKAHKH